MADEHQLPGNVTAFPNRAAIKVEAGDWLVRMDREPLTEAELAELQQWMGQSSFHRDYLMKLAANWDAMARLQELAELFPLPESESSVYAQSFGWAMWLRRPWGQGVAVVCTLVLVVALGWLVNGIMPTDLRTTVGEQGSFTLPDGSVVNMNTDTHIEVDFSESRRAITLLKGEASFDVRKNPERPFVVYAGGGLVWAVGTAFNVRYLGDSVDVLVTEGRVKVFSDTNINQRSALDLKKAPDESKNVAAGLLVLAENELQEALVGAGQALQYAQVIKSLRPVEVDEFERKLAWQQGALIFKGESLKEAIAEIGRYTDKKLVIADPELNTLKVGGHYKTDDIKSLLVSLGEGLNIDIQYDNHNRILLTSR